MRHFGKVLFPLLVGVFMLNLAGCVEKEGPAEKAGEKLDDAADDVKDAAD
ncbi:MAG: hypothetical protein QOD06_2429 [Candidatus Binatota bacterium]|jgi:hypothetical protein|nr:hypothetical protein [Candidatus Binatota bacterium]